MSSSPDVAATILAYDRGAAEYAKHSRDRGHMARLREPFMALLEENARVLDLGCGPGHDAALLAGRGARVVGLDPAQGLLREARAHDAIAGSLVGGEARRMPFGDASFDGVWSCASLLHVPHAELPQAVSEVHRVLRPGGFAFFSLSEGDPEGVVPVSNMELETRAYYYLDAEAWGAMLQEHGFQLISHRVNRESGNFNPGSTGWIETYARNG